MKDLFDRIEARKDEMTVDMTGVLNSFSQTLLNRSLFSQLPRSLQRANQRPASTHRQYADVTGINNPGYCARLI